MRVRVALDGLAFAAGEHAGHDLRACRGLVQAFEIDADRLRARRSSHCLARVRQAQMHLRVALEERSAVGSVAERAALDDGQFLHRHVDESRRASAQEVPARDEDLPVFVAAEGRCSLPFLSRQPVIGVVDASEDLSRLAHQHHSHGLPGCGQVTGEGADGGVAEHLIQAQLRRAVPGDGVMGPDDVQEIQDGVVVGWREVVACHLPPTG